MTETSPQDKAAELAEKLRQDDMAAMAQMNTAGREEQERIRKQLYYYADSLWDTVKAAGRSVKSDPGARAVADMRDLAAALYAYVRSAQRDAGDLD